jgi:GNAT superfamily N-acetyltransferase
LPQLQALINLHLGAVIPGWALPLDAIAQSLSRDDSEPTTDPWVVERATVCVRRGYTVLAAAHLLRYGTDPEVSTFYRDLGEVGWMLALPTEPAAAAEVLAAARAQIAAWGVQQERGWGAGLPIVPIWGVPDCWPHICSALLAAGYRPDPAVHREALYGGVLDSKPVPGPPVAGLSLHRSVGSEGKEGVRFAALLEDEELGWCQCGLDVGRGGAIPALRGWAELCELRVRDGWRNRGIGRWLVQHALCWLRLARCDRLVVSTDEEAEAAGIDRFYRRFGWEVFVRETHGWR